MTQLLQVNLLGGATFSLDKRPVNSLPTRAAQALLIYLLHQPRPIERERLMDMFYQASSPKQAAANLRSTLSRLRKELDPFLIVTRQTVGIAPEANIQLDSALFASRAAVGEWEAALPLYQGDFLAGFYLREAPEFEEWALLQREHLRLLAVEGLQKLVAERRQRGDYWGALQAVTQLLGIEPLLEQAHRDKMLLLARTGQRPLALQQYQTIVEIFATEMGIAVAAETVALYERIARLKLPPPGRLPALRRQFIGRAAELTALRQALPDATRRLITLTGVGGVGKTRLALAAARRLYAETPGHFLDGLYFVELAGVSDGNAAIETLAAQIAQTLALSLAGNQPIAEQLTAYLREREILLILDNFEQLLPTAVDFIARLLQEAPRLTLLITTRERLNLYEEAVLNLDGLTVPATDDAPDESTEATRLFLDNVQRRSLNFTADAATMTAVAAICRLLAGVPLAIELAAGWSQDDSVAEIARRIAQSAAFLTTDLRNVPDRQRSLQAVFRHSWELLSADLQPVLANLSVFPGRFSLAAAQAIAGADKQALAALTDKSLLQQTADDQYAIHPLLREFAAAQLDAAADAQMRQRHSDYFAAFIAERSQTDRRPAYLKHLPDLVAAYDDLRLAWRWTVDQLVNAESEAAWRRINQMRRPLIRLHFQRNWFYAARALFGAARQKIERHGWREAADPRRRLLHAQLTVAEGNSARILGDLAAALEPIAQVVPLLRTGGDLDSLFDAYNALAGIAMQQGDLDRTADLLEELEAIAVETNRTIFYGVLYTLRSYYTDYRGDAAGALSQAQHGLEAFRAIEDTFYEAILLDGVARRLFTLGRPEEAAAVLRRADALAEENEQTLTKAFIRKGLAFYHRERGELAEAEASLAESRELFIAANDQRNLVEIDLSCALIARQRRQWPQMTRHLHASLTQARRLAMGPQMLEAAACLPLLQAQRDQAEMAYRLAHFLLAQAELGDAQRAIITEALAQVEGELPLGQRQTAERIAASLTLDDAVDSFLTDGLKWFAPGDSGIETA